MRGNVDNEARIAALAEARRRGAARLAQWQDGLPEPFAPAALEFAKAGLGEGEIRCGSGDSSGRQGGVVAALRYFGLAIVAWFGVLFALCRYPGADRRLPGKRLVALHGEVSNRTRHLLEAIKAGEPADAVLVLGLPRCSLAHLREAWSPWLAGRELALVRPVSPAALLASWPEAWRAVRGAFRLASTCPASPSARALAAILARLWLGEAHACWWLRHGGEVVQVSYGHTGTADTSRLEQAQQAAGAKTVHVVHGVSAGRNFMGLSSVAVWRCGHDADWHTRLGGYGRNEWVPAEQPSWRRGEEGLLLLSSFAHPMYLGYRLGSITEEIALLRAVAEAAMRARIDGAMTWLPHPASKLLPEAERRLMAETAESLGFVLAPPGKGFMELARTSRWVVSSESTVVIDLLAEGVASLMWPSLWGEPGAALFGYPLRRQSTQALADGLLLSPEALASHHAQAWAAIRPGLKASQAGRSRGDQEVPA